MDLQFYLMTLFILAAGIVLLLIVTEGGHRRTENRKLAADDQVDQAWLDLRNGLLSLPETERREVLLAFRQTVAAYLRLNGLSPHLAHLSAQPNRPLAVVVGGKAASRN